MKDPVPADAGGGLVGGTERRVFQNLLAIGNLAGGDLSPVGKLMSLLVLPFAHEDLAIILGGYIIVNKLMPASLVALSIYGGIVASDLALYGVGYSARRIHWLRRYTSDSRVRKFSDTIRRNVFGLVALCRVVPGVVFVAFIACGWMRVSFWRFTTASMLVSAVYLPLMLYLVIVFGDALDDKLGLMTWPLLFGLFAATGFVRKRVFSFANTQAEAADQTVLDICPGMPAVAAADRKVAAAERIPPSLFYIPMALNWVRLGLHHGSLTLPTAANPNIFTGGMWGETKSSYLLDVGGGERQWIADFVLAKRGGGDTLSDDMTRALLAIHSAGLVFPLIAKPDISWHGHGVQVIADREALEAYIGIYPAGATIVLQRLVDHPAEAAVLYARLPGEDRGRVLSLTLRYFPHVIGDGKASLRDLIRADERASWKAPLHLGGDRTHHGVDAAELDRVPSRGEVVRIALIGNQRAGALYRDGRRFITEALNARFDGISRSMTEFHYGRFDIRFESMDALMRGEGFSVVEINGIGGEAIDVWDPNLPVREVYRRLADQQKLLFLIGERNRARGFEPTPAGEFVSSLFRQSLLISRYPASS